MTKLTTTTVESGGINNQGKYCQYVRDSSKIKYLVWNNVWLSRWSINVWWKNQLQHLLGHNWTLCFPKNWWQRKRKGNKCSFSVRWAPLHYGLNVQVPLRDKFFDCWIGPVLWPPRNFDLTIVDDFSGVTLRNCLRWGNLEFTLF